MSKVVRVVGGVVGTVVGFATGQSWLATASIALFLGGAQELLLRRPRISRPGDPYRDLSTNVSDPVGALPVIYGEQTVGVHRVWAHTENEIVNGVTNTNRFLYIMCAVAHGPVKGMTQVIFDGYVTLTQVHPNRFINGTGSRWFDIAHAQWASGTDGQYAVIPSTDSRTLTSITRSLTTDNLTATTSTAHPFVPGDVLRVTGNSTSGYNLPGGYTVLATPTSTTLTLVPRSGQPTGTGTGGTIDYYNMDPAAIASGEGPTWSTAARGRGVAYLLVRLRYDETEHSGMVPTIQVRVEGRALRDTRSVTTLTVSSSASGPARTGYASTVDLTFTANHGRSVGDQLLVSGHSAAYLNGYQRVDEVVDADTVRIYTPYSAGTGGTAEVLTYSRNPAMAVRDYLTSTRYGVAAATSELDETAFQSEANYCDQLVPSKVPAGIRHEITGTTTTNPVLIGVGPPHPHPFGGGTVRIRNHPTAALNAEWTATTVDAFTFSVPFDNSAGSALSAGHVDNMRSYARYEVNAALSPAESLKTNLEKLLSSFRALMIYQGGVYRTWTRRVAYPGAFELTPNNIIPGSVRVHRPGLAEAANMVRAAFYNLVKQSTPDFALWPTRAGYTNPELTTEDNGFESLHEIDLPCTNDAFMAEQIAQVVRNESRAGVTVGVTATQAALQLAVGDLVSVTHDTPQWNRKKFWVLQVGIQPDGLVALTLLEYKDTAYTSKWYPDEA